MPAPDVRDELRRLINEGLLFGSFSPRTNVIRLRRDLPVAAFTTGMHELAHFMQFNGTSFGVYWNYLDAIRTRSAMRALRYLSPPSERRHATTI